MRQTWMLNQGYRAAQPFSNERGSSESAAVEPWDRWPSLCDQVSLMWSEDNHPMAEYCASTLKVTLPIKAIACLVPCVSCLSRVIADLKLPAPDTTPATL